LNPYLIDTPATISFSGGRTSGFMLRKILDAFGGKLPDDVLVCFNNTGREHPKTYEFVRDVEAHWGCKIHWLEYRIVDDKPTFAEVTFETASRKGEPFDALIEHRKMLPNPTSRFCTVELKIRTAARAIRARGWGEYTNAIGLRADERHRVARMRGDNKNELVAMPIADAGHTIDDVLAFWKEQPFDLMLPGGNNAFGNCVGCFLKGYDKTLRLMREEPEHFEWWAEKERTVKSLGRVTGDGALFRADRPTYAQLMEIARTQSTFDFDTYDTLPCACTD